MKAKTLFYGMIGLLVLALLAGGASYLLLSKRLNQTTDAIAAREVDILIADERKSHLRSLQGRLDELGPLRDDIKGLLPKEKDQSVIVAQLVAAGQQNKISFNSITFDASSKLPSQNSQIGPSSISSRVSSVPVHLQSGETTYGRVKGFLSALKALQRHVSMKTLIISRGNEGSLTFSADVEVHTDVLAPAAPKAPGPQGADQ